MWRTKNGLGKISAEKLRGAIMGAVRSKFARAVRAQVETEAKMHKVIGKEKPTQAPRHPSTVAKYEKLISGNK